MDVPRTSKIPERPEQLGWTWTEEDRRLPEAMSNNRPWPRISVITPSYNQGQFIEQTIRSVLHQGYPNLEYIIIDGGSSDQSVEIIKKYEEQLAYWTSEPDRGQSHAINKGFEKSTGQIMCWLNSDDYFLPGTLQTVAEHLADETGNFALVGHCIQVYTDGRQPVKGIGRYEDAKRLLQFWKGYQMHQPSIFWRREVFNKIGYLDEAQHYIMDFDYWVRMARHFDFKSVDRALSCATYHKDAKTGDDFYKYYQELKRQAPKYWPPVSSMSYWSLKLSMALHLSFLPGVRRLRSQTFYYLRRLTMLLESKSS